MKKYVITGSIGHISKVIVQGLVKAGKEVTVITSSADRAAEIEKLGAQAKIGSIQNAGFINEAFKGAEVVYTMIPPIWQTTNWRKSQNEVAAIYANAIKANNVPYVVNLSSIGAHIGKGTGPIDGVYDLEQMLNALPQLNVKHLRPSSFYYNFLNQIGLIKHAGIMGANYGEGEKMFLVDTKDIAAAAIEELLSLNFKGYSVRYIIGDEKTGQEVADVLGKAVKKELKWVVFTDEEQKQGLLQAGVPETHATAFTEMGAGLRKGYIQEDARKNMPVLSPVKLEDFAKEFARAFQGSEVAV